MKKEIIGILICILLTSIAVAPVINALTIEKNGINELKEPTFSLQNLPLFQVSESNLIVNHNIKKLITPQPTPWPPDDKCVGVGFGLIYNVKREFNGDEHYWSFNCENVICSNYGESWFTWHHFTNGEVLYLIGAYIGIITDNFLFILAS